MSKDKLTDKQKAFCHEYVIDWNAARAARAAGYSEKTATDIGCENLAKPYIADYIEHIQTDLQKLAGVSALSNIKTLLDIVNDPDGVMTKDRIKAIEVVNKMVGYNAPEKTEITLETLTDEERIRRIAALKGKMDGD